LLLLAVRRVLAAGVDEPIGRQRRRNKRGNERVALSLKIRGGERVYVFVCVCVCLDLNNDLNCNRSVAGFETGYVGRKAAGIRG
jgi:hypothetical protein